MSAYADPMLAAVHIELQPDGDGMTNAAVLLVRADQLQPDESGEHPGERFAMVSITRAELLGILQSIEDDWQDHCRFADPLANDAPLLTTQARSRVDVLLSLLDQAAEVLDTIEPEDSAEADKLGALLGHMREAAAAWRGEHG